VRQIGRSSSLVAVVLVAASFLTAGPVAAGPSSSISCAVFPDDNVWHLDVSNLPRHPRSDSWLRSTHARRTLLHPDFGPPSYGIPYDVVDASHADVGIDFQYADESDAGPYPFGSDIQIEGGSDRHAIMVDASTCTLYELYGAHWNGGAPTAGSGAVFDLTSNALRPDGWTSADAAGLSIFAGLLRYDEVVSGVVDHAIRMTVSCTHDAYMWPARHRAGTNDRHCPPMGARFRLRAGFDAGAFDPDTRVVIRAMKRYGTIVADNGSDWYFQGTVDTNWPASLIEQLKQVPARAFVAVDEHACRVAPDTGQFAYGAGCPAP
jgi:hypothetical protein